MTTEKHLLSESLQNIADALIAKDAEIGRLRRKMQEIHEILSDHLAPAWQVIENAAATARSALEPDMGTT